MALNVGSGSGRFLVDLKTFEKNCRGCEYVDDPRGAPFSHHVGIACKIHDGISAIVEGCPGPRRKEEKK